MDSKQMTPEHWHIDNEFKRDKLIEFIRDKNIPEFGYVAWFEFGKRTTKQNNSLWLYCTQLAQMLNDAGYDFQISFLGKTVDVPFTRDIVMEYMWRPIQIAETGKKSTTKLDRAEVSQVYEILARWLASTKHVVLEFPTWDH